MKHNIKIIYISAIALSVVGVAATLHRICGNICEIRYISYSFDPQLSPQTRAAIEKQVALLECDGKYQPAVVMQELLRIFPDIKQVDIRSLPYNLAEITVHAPDPVARINNTQVLTQDCTIIPADFYACYTLNQLPHLQLSSRISHTVSQELMAAVKKSIKERLFDHFMVCMKDEQEWYLQDKQDPNFTICCNASCLPLGAIRQACDQLKKTIKQQKGAKLAWLADVRFDHQIVLSRYKGGRNGKGIQ